MEYGGSDLMADGKTGMQVQEGGHGEMLDR